MKEIASEFDLEVFYYSNPESGIESIDPGFGQKVTWDIPLFQGYKATFLKNLSRRKSLSNRLWDAVNPSVINSLLKSKSTIVILNGWSYFSDLLVIVLARIIGKKVWLRADNPMNQESKKSRKILFLKKIVLKYFLFQIVHRFLFVGIENRLFFKFYGVNDNQLIYTPHAVDNCQFRRLSNQQSKQELKFGLGLNSDTNVILFCGKYIVKKRPLDLIKAFHSLNLSSCQLVMVGEGTLRNEMETYILENGIKNVVLTGFINQSEIGKYYATADIFVMPSGMGETWGLSVNEAMNFGLPVIISKTCGCAADLVHDNVNGFSYEEGDVGALAYHLQKLILDESLRLKFGAASIQIIDQFTIKHIVANLKSAVV